MVVAYIHYAHTPLITRPVVIDVVFHDGRDKGAGVGSG